MSIESQLTALATNKAAIKAAIGSKNPVTAPTDALAQWPTAIASIPSGGSDGPKPWVGSGTHCWVHYDSNSHSHVCKLIFNAIAAGTLDWGDGSPTEPYGTGINIAPHTFADGDYRIDLSANTISLGTYDPSTGSVSNSSRTTFFSDGNYEFNGYQNAIPEPREALVQFETDATAIIGNGNAAYCPIGANANLKWIKLTECLVFGNAAMVKALGLLSFDAPKLTHLYGGGNCWPKLKSLSIPSVASFYQPNTTSNPFTTMTGLAIEEFTVPARIGALPPDLCSAFYQLKSFTFATRTSSDPTLVLNGGICRQTFSLESLIFPEGIVEIPGETCRESGVQLLEFPSTLQSISNQWAFYYVPGLTTLICRAVTPPTIAHSRIFNSLMPNAVFYIPYGTTAAYTSANNWSQFASRFVEMNPDGTIPTT